MLLQASSFPWPARSLGQLVSACVALIASVSPTNKKNNMKPYVFVPLEETAPYAVSLLSDLVKQRDALAKETLIARKFSRGMLRAAGISAEDLEFIELPVPRYSRCCEHALATLKLLQEQYRLMRSVLDECRKPRPPPLCAKVAQYPPRPMVKR
jgi:hypothetical protein